MFDKASEVSLENPKSCHCVEWASLCVIYIFKVPGLSLSPKDAIERFSSFSSISQACRNSNIKCYIPLPFTSFICYHWQYPSDLQNGVAYVGYKSVNDLENIVKYYTSQSPEWMTHERGNPDRNSQYCSFIHPVLAACRTQFHRPEIQCPGFSVTLVRQRSARAGAHMNTRMHTRTYTHIHTWAHTQFMGRLEIVEPIQ